MAIYTYNQILVAITRAEQAAQTYYNVATSDDDFTPAEFSDIKTLARRIYDHLDVNLETLRGQDGLGVINVGVSGRDVIVDYTDDTQDIFTNAIPADGTSITNYTIDVNGNLIETTTDGSQPKGQIIGFDGNHVTNIAVQPTGELFVEYDDGTSAYVGMIDNYGENPITSTTIIDGDLFVEIAGEFQIAGHVEGEQGKNGIEPADYRVHRTANTNDVYLDIILSDGYEITNLPTQVTTRVAELSDALSADLTDGVLTITLPTEEIVTLGEDVSLNGIDGADGLDGDDGFDGRAPIENSATFSTAGDAFFMDFTDGIDFLVGTPKQIIVPPGDTSITSHRITANGNLIFDLLIGTETVSVNVGQVRGIDGADGTDAIHGRTITNATIDIDENLVVTIDDNGTITDNIIGTVSYDRVTSAYINELRQLVIEREVNEDIVSEVTVDGENGLAGDFVSDIQFNEDDGYLLTLVLTSGDGFILDRVRPVQTHSVAVVGRDLVFTFTDATSKTVGQVVGEPGRNLTNYQLTANELTLEYDNGAVVEAVPGTIRNLTGLEYDHVTGQITTTLDDTSTLDVPYVRGEDGIHGKWITDMDIVDGNLTVTYNDAPLSPVIVGEAQGHWITDIINDGGSFYAQWTNKAEPTFIGSIPGIDGDNGRWIASMSIVNGDLQVTWSDDGELTTPQVIGRADGRWGTSAYNTGDDIFVQFSNEVDPTLVGSVLGFDGDDAKYITDFSLDVDRNLIVTYSDGTTENVSPIDGDDGRWITDFYRTGDDFYVRYSNDTVDTLVGSIESFDGDAARYITDMSIDVDRKVTVTYDGEATPTIVGEADGADARWITDFYRTDDNFFVRYNNEGTATNVGTITGFDGDHGEWIVDMRINANRELEVQYDDLRWVVIGFVDYDMGVTNIELINGKIVFSTPTGTTESDQVIRRVENATTVNDNLSLTTNYGDPISAGLTNGDDVADGVYVVDLEIRSGQLYAVLSDNYEILAGTFNRNEVVDGSLYGLSNENLRLTLTDGTNIDLGRVLGASAERNIIDAYINATYELVLTFNDIDPVIAGQVRGDDGASISSSTVDASGDFVVTMDDTTTINAGNVLQDFGFAPYDPFRTYNEGESCTLNGTIYVATENGVTVEPTPSSTVWGIVRLEGDPSPDATRPDLINPINGEVFSNRRPYLLGGPIRTYFSVDERNYREFQVDLVSDDFSNPVYTAQENADGHQVELDLDLDTEYKWRARDVIKQTGYVTGWSAVETFSVKQGQVGTPVVGPGSGLDMTSMYELAGFQSSTYSGFGSHVSSSWQVRRESDGFTIFEELNSTEDLIQNVIPFGVLYEGTDYSVRVRYHGTVGDSSWSNWTPFTTRNRFDFRMKPIVSYVGDNSTYAEARPSFSVETGLPDFIDGFMGDDRMIADWEIRESVSGAIVWETYNSVDIRQVQSGIVLNSGTEYKIRVRYLSDRFRNASEWSEYVTFTPVWSIGTPTISSPLNLAEMPLDNSEFTTNVVAIENDVVYFTQWEITDDLGTVIQTTTKETDVYSWITDFAVEMESGVFTIRVKHFGRYVESEWSLPLEFTVESYTPVYVYSGSGDTTVKKIDPVGVEVWTFTGHTNQVWGVAVDQSGYVYSASYDHTARKIDPNGTQVWSFTGHTADVHSIAVDPTGNVYSGAWDNTVRKIDPTGVQIWSFTGHISPIYGVDVDVDGNVYSCAGDNTVKKIDPNGVGVWTFTGHTGNVNDVTVDVNGFVYSGSTDNTVKKIDPTGVEVWSFTGHTHRVYGVAVDPTGNVYSGAWDNTVRKIDPTGVQIWSFTGHTNAVYDVAIDVDGNVYSGTASTGNIVKKIDPTGVEVWSFTGHTSDVYGVACAPTPVLLKPVDGSGTFTPSTELHQPIAKQAQYDEYIYSPTSVELTYEEGTV